MIDLLAPQQHRLQHELLLRELQQRRRQQQEGRAEGESVIKRLVHNHCKKNVALIVRCHYMTQPLAELREGCTVVLKVSRCGTITCSRRRMRRPRGPASSRTRRPPPAITQHHETFRNPELEAQALYHSTRPLEPPYSLHTGLLKVEPDGFGARTRRSPPSRSRSAAAARRARPAARHARLFTVNSFTNSL